MNKPFKVVNCLSQGFAVAGPPEKRTPRGAQAESEKAETEIDFEMVLWGMSLDKATAMAAELNADANGGGHRPPLHGKD